MKNIITVFCLLALPFALSNCKKDANEIHTVTGKLLLSCSDNTPEKGVTIFLYNDNRGTLRSCDPGRLGTALTNDKGEFSITYSETCAGLHNGSITLRYINNNRIQEDLVTNILPNRSLQLGSLYTKENVQYQFVVKTTKPYTSADTLFYDIEPKGGLDSTYKFVTGPFQNQMVIGSKEKAVILDYRRELKRGIICDWILKSGSTIIKPETRTIATIGICDANSTLEIDLSK